MVEVSIVKHKKYDKFEMKDKKLYIPYIISWICPNCGKKYNEDLTGIDGYYLSYPKINTPHEYTLYCGDCNDNNLRCEWDIKIKLNINLELI
jgi:hypothetical protein